MDREWLVAQLSSGLSLDGIADRANSSPSTVSYWLTKHGLRANGAERFGRQPALDADDLVGLVADGLSVPEIAVRVDRSRDVVRRALRRHGLETRGSANRRRAAEAAREGLRTVVLECRHHGCTEHVLEGELLPLHALQGTAGV